MSASKVDDYLAFCTEFLEIDQIQANLQDSIEFTLRQMQLLSRRFFIAEESAAQLKSELMEIKNSFDGHKHKTKFQNNSNKTRIQTLERKIKIVSFSLIPDKLGC